MARVATPAGVDGAHSNFLDLVAVFDFVYAVSWREEKKNITVMLQNETTDVNVIFSACTGCKFSLYCKLSWLAYNATKTASCLVRATPHSPQ